MMNEFLEAAQKVLGALVEAPPNHIFGGSLGSGGRARLVGDCYRSIIPGDSTATVLHQVTYLLGDLAVDLDLSPDEIGAIYSITERMKKWNCQMD